MNINNFDYSLPKNLIANAPADPRDSSRLMSINRSTGEINNKYFYDLVDLLTPNDCLVLNDTKVFPARMYGKKDTGGSVEILLVENLHGNVWEILGKKIPKMGGGFYIDEMCAKVIEKSEEKTIVEFTNTDKGFNEFLKIHGHTPIPPYIHTNLHESDLRQKYQTKYARKTGSIAAPTAGLHFTKELLEKLKMKGVQIEYVTLHVGMGTFMPVKTQTLEKHEMHSEWFNVDPETAKRLNRAKIEGKRIVSVGTTTTRVLETISNNTSQIETSNLSGTTDIFIYPRYKFKFVDSLITNFHLPKSTLLALISAFVSAPQTGNKFTDFKHSLVGRAYVEAIERSYQFYSFGDAMYIC